MKQLLDIFRQQSSKIYELDINVSQENLTIFCQENNCELFYLDGEDINNKQTFFQGCLSAMNLPEYFGNNWDAWEDCLTDLSWCKASAYLFYYHKSQNFATNSPQDWTILLDILREAIAYWQQQNIPFFVVLSQN
jgi:RNAse (barnase) inhibitor barstar